MKSKTTIWMAYAFGLIGSLYVFASPAYGDVDDVQPHTCGQQEAQEKLYQENPALEVMQQNMEQDYAFHMNLSQFGLSPALLDDEGVLTLPVVYHILLPPGAEDISDEEVQNSLDWLNEQFANIPGSQLPPGEGFYRPDGTNTNIEFAFALQDPDGNPINGINRVTVNFNSIGTGSPNAATDVVAWPSEDYVNIWVVNNIVGAAGFAYLPTSVIPDYRGGIFVERGYLDNVDYFGGDTPYEFSHRNHVFAHEMGHYLGLRHTFQNNSVTPGCTPGAGEEDWVCNYQSNTNCLTSGDRICDTPPDGWADVSTGTTCYGEEPMNTSDTDADDTSSNNPFTTDVNDIHANIMDYGGFQCVNQLTNGQKSRMRYVIENMLSSLLTSPALEAPDTDDCIYNAPTLSLDPREIHAKTLNESGEIIATVKNNNIGTCPQGSFTLSVSEQHEDVDINIVLPASNLSSQQEATVNVQYELSLKPDTNATVKLSVGQLGQSSSATKSIMFHDDTADQGPTSVADNPFATKNLQGDGKYGGSGDLGDDIAAKSGCQSGNGTMFYLLLMMLGYISLGRKKQISS